VRGACAGLFGCLVLAVACGRLGYDPLTRADAGPDALPDTPSDAQVLPPAEHLYWADPGAEVVGRVPLGGGPEEIVLTGVDVNDIAIDPRNGFLYWTSELAGTVSRRALSGGTPEVVVPSVADPEGLCVDADRGQIYWVAKTAGQIWRARSDGSEAEVVVQGIGSPEDIAIDPVRRLLFVADSPAILRVDLDTGAQVPIATANLVEPEGIALDRDQQRVYWADRGRDTMVRADYQGGMVTDLFVSGSDMEGVDFDPAGFLYWTDWGNDTINRARSDGSDRSVLSTGMQPTDVTLGP
jgi:sugar lactone lactonase YvrE